MSDEEKNHPGKSTSGSLPVPKILSLHHTAQYVIKKGCAFTIISSKNFSFLC
ncbi:MAG: hypothetical protein ABI416_05005 [Ginsengibacter sp.]